ncbi:TatD family hydrolase [Pseudoloma neurophilia]|uniref:TatD family hydrolase n=1 Tax=Pseudoloma neurophilia TaxID=146866 RepID=A0A0R0M0P5_9MICR|nr:TatD family hydrolase [Pseudoloma neurophilia]
MFYIDMACNITYYSSEKKNRPSIDTIMTKCKELNVLPLFIGTDEKSNEESLKLAKEYNTFCTLGIHPTESSRFLSIGLDNQYFNKLLQLYNDNENVLAIGECGLDWDRLKFSSKDDQIKVLKMQLSLFDKNTDLPYFFHCRSAYQEFLNILKNQSEKYKTLKGIIHCFTGNKSDLELILNNTNLYIGLTGLFFNLSDYDIGDIFLPPLNRLFLETDSPYCKLKNVTLTRLNEFITKKDGEPLKSNQTFKNHYTSCDIPLLYKFVAKLYDITEEQLKEQIYNNFRELFKNKSIKTNF